jgi:hypothetical protein
MCTMNLLCAMSDLRASRSTTRSIGIPADASVARFSSRGKSGVVAVPFCLASTISRTSTPRSIAFLSAAAAGS